MARRPLPAAPGPWPCGGAYLIEKSGAVSTMSDEGEPAPVENKNKRFRKEKRR